MPAFQPHQAFLEAVEFDEEEAVKVVDASAEFFRAARTLALGLLRQGDLAAKELTDLATSAAAIGGADGGGANRAVAPPPGEGGGVADLFGGGWAVDRLELLALAKLAVANGVAAMQVMKRYSAAGSAAAAAAAGAGAGVALKKGEVWRAKLDFGSHSQFPVVRPTFG